MRQLAVIGILVVASACRSEPPAVSPSPRPAAVSPGARPEPTPDGDLQGSSEPEPEPLAVPEEPVPMAPRTEEKEEEPREVRFGVPLPLGLYTFPDGLRLRFSATHECEYDSTAPCSSFEVVSWFKGREAKATSLMPSKVVRIAGHSVQLTEDQSLIVRK